MAKTNNSNIYTKITIAISLLVICVLIFLYLGFQTPGFLVNKGSEQNQTNTEQTSSSPTSSTDLTQTPNFDDYKGLSVSLKDNQAIVISNNTASNYPITVYSDFRCPGCQELESSVYWKYILDLVKSRAFDLTIYPVAIHEGNEKELGLIEGGAALSLAKNNPDEFLRINSLMMKNGETIKNKDALIDILNSNKVSKTVIKDVSENTYTDQILGNTSTKANPTFQGGTPQVMINNENVNLKSLLSILQGYIDQLK